MASQFQIRYTQEVAAEIQALRAFESRKIVDAIEQHLLHGPKTESRSRIKRMKQPFWSQFRLRVDEFRVYYDVDDGQQLVNVLRVLRKTTASTPGDPP
jgi:mRNA interferase RelE/StbE